MLIYRIDTQSPTKISGIVVHNTKTDEKISFVGENTINGLVNEEDFYKGINTFFESASDEVSDRHWKYLKEAKRILNPGYFGDVDTEESLEMRRRSKDYQFIGEKIAPIVKKIYNNIKSVNITYALETYGYIDAPKDLNAITIYGDYPEATTITVSKYKDLASLAFYIQLSFPIVNQYMRNIHESVGSDYKNYIAGLLYEDVEQVTKHPGFIILKDYILASIERIDINKCNINFIGSNDKFISDLIYKGLFMKLSLNCIPNKKDNKTFVNGLSALIKQLTKIDKTNVVQPYSGKSNDGSDLSLAETYKILEETNGSDEFAQAEYFTFDLIKEDSPGVFTKAPSNFFKHQCAGLGIKNQALAEKIYNTLPTNWNYHLEDIHTTLLQLTFQYKINYRIYAVLDYDQLMAASALAQTKLFEMGFENLATCVFAVQDPDVLLKQPDRSYELNAKERDMLESICSENIGVNDKNPTNAAVDAVKKFLNALASSGWSSNIEPGLLGNERFVDLMSPNNRYPIDITSDIKTELLKLIALRNDVQDWQ